MKYFPLRIIQLSVLFVCIFGAISCEKDNDLMTEYVLSATMNPEDMAISTSDNLDATDAKYNNMPDALTNETKSNGLQLAVTATSNKGTVEIDDITNTIIYTAPTENAVSTGQLTKTVAK
ncbi:MAG: hypothetical protein MUO53_10990 [Maribacter sp.]|nr:hypothetical protein [Maribacter sp.]